MAGFFRTVSSRYNTQEKLSEVNPIISIYEHRVFPFLTMLWVN